MAQIDKTAIDLWKSHMLSMDYTNPSYKTNPSFLEAPLFHFDRFTLYRLSRLITSGAMADPESQTAQSPIDKRLLAEHALDGDRARLPEKPHIMAHIAPNEATTDNPRDRVADIDFQPTEAYQDERGKGEYTHGIKLNAWIAGKWHSQEGAEIAADGSPFPPGDPHPMHPILLPPHHILPSPAETVDAIQSDVARVLNTTGKVVASVVDPNEHLAWWQKEQMILERLADGVPYDEAVTKPTDDASDVGSGEEPQLFQFSNDVAQRAVDELPDLMIRILTAGGLPEGVNEASIVPDFAQKIQEAGLIKGPGKRENSLSLRDFRPAEIQTIASAVPNLLAKTEGTKDLTPEDLVEIQTRVERIVMSRVIAAQRDPCAFAIPRMKGRYQSWSVSWDRTATLRWVRSQDYKNCPGDAATRPVDMYVWAAIEVASPVLRSGEPADPLLESLTAVCEALKYRFRTHHCAIPALDLTTSIFIGHTEGFTLLELKKLVTLWLAIEPKLAFLHSQRRRSPWGCWPSGTLRLRSRLGALLLQSLHAPLEDPLHIMPHPSDETREFFTTQMHAHFNAGEVLNGVPETDELFMRTVWQYSSVSELARAMETAEPPNRVSLAIRCEGGGHRTSHRSTRDDTGADGFDKPFLGKIDQYRGVVEFRQMGQSLEQDTIMAWANVCGKVVKAVRETNHVAFWELMRMALRDEVTLWSMLGVDVATKDHFRECFTPDEKGYFLPKTENSVDYGYPFYKTGKEKFAPRPERKVLQYP